MNLPLSLPSSPPPSPRRSAPRSRRRPPRTASPRAGPFAPPFDRPFFLSRFAPAAASFFSPRPPPLLLASFFFSSSSSSSNPASIRAFFALLFSKNASFFSLSAFIVSGTSRTSCGAVSDSFAKCEYASKEMFRRSFEFFSAPPPPPPPLLSPDLPFFFPFFPDGRPAQGEQVVVVVVVHLLVHDVQTLERCGFLFLRRRRRRPPPPPWRRRPPRRVPSGPTWRDRR